MTTQFEPGTIDYGFEICYHVQSRDRQTWLKKGAMHLYLLTLQRPTCIVQAIHGNFSGTKQQEIVVGRGRILELLRPDPNTGKVHTLLSIDVFGEIRSLIPFKLTGGAKGNL